MESPSPTSSRSPLSSEAFQPKNLDLALTQIHVIDSLMPSASRRLEDASPAPSSTVLAGVEIPAPDPRWPSKFRWSVKAPPSTTSMANPTTLTTTTNGSAPSPARLTEQSHTVLKSNFESTSKNVVSDLSDPVTGDVQPELPPALLPSESSKGTDSLTVLAEVLSEPSHPVSAPQGAWSQPLKIISSGSPFISMAPATELSTPENWPTLTESKKGQALIHNPIRKSYKAATQNVQIQADRKEDDLRFPWAAKMNPASRNLYRATEPEYLDDGTPKVTIPRHVLAQGLETHKEYIIGQFYRCSLPPGGLIYAVFNKLWGRKCRISIRKLGESNYLFHIPDEATRIWVLQRGLWHVDDCLMFVAPWIPEATLAIPEIKTIPVWVTLKKIPNICYSIAGISHIASGLGAPMATHKPRLDPILMGEAKILVEVELSKAFPPKIAASDETGFISMVDVEYAWLPTKCSRCGQLGHKVKRCLQAATANEVEDGNVIKSIVSNPVDSSQSSVPVNAISNEVTHSTNIVVPAKESIIFAPDPTTTTASPKTNQVITTIAHSSVLPVDNDFTIESPPLGTAPLIPPLTSAHSKEIIVSSNRFESLASFEEGEDLLESDTESDPTDLMTPLGKRILRERPVKPSAKAKENSLQIKDGGRGNQGRGKRGGRG